MDLSRLVQKSAWRKTTLVIDAFLLLILIAEVFFLIKNPTDTLTITVLWTMLLIFIVHILDGVCVSGDYFTLADGQVKVCVFQNVTPDKRKQYKIQIIEGKQKTCYLAADYEVPFRTQNARCFVLQGDVADKQSWFVWSADKKEATHLGICLNKIMFLPEKGVRILTPDGHIEQINGDYITYGRVFIPKGSELYYAEKQKNPQLPDKYLLVRENNLYNTYGVYLYEEIPYCREVIVSSVIFREGADRVLLQYDKKEQAYRKTFRCLDVSRVLNEYFIEMTKEYNCGGNIYCYNGKTEILEKIYTGGFCVIDFDEGLVLGADGNEYGNGSMYATI